jgi:hypothetical protein
MKSTMSSVDLLNKAVIAFILMFPALTFAQVPAAFGQQQLPTAMEPQKVPPTARTLEAFQRISKETSMARVIETLGLPDKDIGSGIYIYVYELADGSQVIIGSPDGKQILYMSHVLKNGEKSDLYKRRS